MDMKKVIICEKPLLAKFAVSCISENFTLKKIKGSEHDNYFESEHYYITFAFGHLFEAYDIEDYTKEEGDWKLDNLPFFPPNNQFYFKLKQRKNSVTKKKETDPSIKKQFEAISYLINLTETSGIIHYGDAGREGEVIVRQIIRNANKSNKPVVRLWVNAMEKNTFMAAFSNMKPDSEYDNLANEGMARIKTDFLYGINLTRYISLKAKVPKGKPLRAGRVLCAMVYEIYLRELKIEQFCPEKYYLLVSNEKTNGEEIKLRFTDKYSIDDYINATEKCAQLNQAKAFVQSITTERKIINPGRLYSLTSLQSKLSSKFKISLDDSMKAIQSVYEQGYITYPRTNTEYLPEGEIDMAKSIINTFIKEGYDLEFRNSKTIFNSSKVEDHGALCPTTKIPEKLTGNEKIVYETVRNRFLAVFCKESCTVDKSVMEVICANEKFHINGNVLITAGFTKYDEKNLQDTMLPKLNEGDQVNINFQPVEAETKPPARYSVSSFNEFLENPFYEEKQTDEEKYNAIMKGLEIGTVASRTGIIHNMIMNGYISEKNQMYYLMPAGRYLIETMDKLGIRMTKEKTVETSSLLKKVFDNEMTEDQIIEITKKDVIGMFRNRDINIDDCISSGIMSASGFSGDPIGECPLCGGNIFEIHSGFICENNKRDSDECNFYLNKEDKYIQKISEKKLTSANVSALLRTGYFITKTKSAKGIEYETMLKLKMREDNRVGFEIFNILGKCPVCGGNVKIAPFGYICENTHNDQCFFILFRKDKFINAFLHKDLSLRQAMSIIKQGFFTAQVEKKNESGKYKLKFLVVVDRIEKKITWQKEFS